MSLAAVERVIYTPLLLKCTVFLYELEPTTIKENYIISLHQLRACFLGQMRATKTSNVQYHSIYKYVN